MRKNVLTAFTYIQRSIELTKNQNFVVQSSLQTVKMEHILWNCRKGFLIAWFTFCFIIFIMSLIFYYSVDESKYSNHFTKKYEPIKFSTLINYREVKFNATWVSDDEILTQDDSGNIILYDINKSIKSILAFNSMQHVKNCFMYELSVDRKHLLIGYNVDQTSSGLLSANYDVITVKTGKQVTLRDTRHRPRKILATKWSPVDSSLAIVDNYNIYYIPTVAKPNHAKQITFHGSEDLYHGIPDWVYREEIFHSNSAVWFSTKGTQLAYARFNETLVPSAHLPQYGVPDTMYDQHSRMFSYRYPKVKDANPTVELFVQNLNITSEPVPIPVKPTKYYRNETILYDVAWSNDKHLFAMWMNRMQNESHLVHYHIVNDAAEVIEVIEFKQENGWLDFHGSLLFSPEHQVALIYPIKYKDGEFYRLLCLIRDGGKPKPLFQGPFEVTQLIKWDFEMNEIYFLGNEMHDSERQYVYKINAVKPHEYENLTGEVGCDFGTAELSKNNNYYAHTCSDWNVQYVSIANEIGEIITVWESNKKLQKTLENVAMPRIKFITVPLRDGFKTQVKLILPSKVDESSRNKYPLLIHTYGGPSLNLVLNEFKIDLDVYMCVNHDFVVVEVDGRGTGRRGNKTLFANYKKLGTGEVDDLLYIVKYLQETMPYVSERKTGIWGWGYGGYLAGMALARDEDNVLFNCALSVAPITDWMYHNSVFTERLMGSFIDNFENYRNASLIEHADGLRHKNYMVIHGLSDTEVHFQHSAMLSKELQHKDIVFEQHFYPDQSHKLRNVRRHLYRTIISFMLKHLA